MIKKNYHLPKLRTFKKKLRSVMVSQNYSTKSLMSIPFNRAHVYMTSPSRGGGKTEATGHRLDNSTEHMLI